MGAAAIPFVMLAVSAASTAYGIISSRKAASAQEDAANRQAEASRAAAARLAKDTEEQHQRVIATQEARYGASGLTQAGSPLLVQHESIKQSQEQIRRIIQSGEDQSLALYSSGQELASAGTAQAVGQAASGVSSAFKIGRDYQWW